GDRIVLQSVNPTPIRAATFGGVSQGLAKRASLELLFDDVVVRARADQLGGCRCRALVCEEYDCRFRSQGLHLGKQSHRIQVRDASVDQDVRIRAFPQQVEGVFGGGDKVAFSVLEASFAQQ